MLLKHTLQFTKKKLCVCVCKVCCAFDNDDQRIEMMPLSHNHNKLHYFRSRPLGSWPANITAARKSNVWTSSKPSRKRTQSEQQTVRSSALQKTTCTHVKNGGKLYCQGHSKLIAATAVFAADSFRKRVRHSNGSDDSYGRTLRLNINNYPKMTHMS